LYSAASAIAAAVLLVVIVLACAAAPFYAADIAHTDPFESQASASIILNGESVPLLQPEEGGLGLGVTPIGPTWQSRYFLGADSQGRDVAARVLYGGRNSLLIAAGATFICLTSAAILGVTAGFFGGLTDSILARLLDILWAFPVYLLAMSLSIVLITQDLKIGPLVITSDSILLPIFIIGVVYIPYVARPVRGQVLSLRNSEFVTAAIAIGATAPRILLRDLMPHIAVTLLVYAPLLMAMNLLTESALSFLSIGVQAPKASWGTIIQDGQELIYTRPMVAIAPGLAIILTVIALNILGDSVRDALAPNTRR
jgi:peptide/nickel transport system permease protein